MEMEWDRNGGWLAVKGQDFQNASLPSVFVDIMASLLNVARPLVSNDTGGRVFSSASIGIDHCLPGPGNDFWSTGHLSFVARNSPGRNQSAQVTISETLTFARPFRVIVSAS